VSTEAAEAIPTRPLPTLDEKRLGWSVVHLAWPVVVQQLAYSLVQLVDTYLVGHLGEDALAGLRLGGQVYWLCLAGMGAVGAGTIAVVARAVGAREMQRADATVRTALTMAALWGLVLALGLWSLGEWALGMMGAEPEARRLGAEYLRASAIGMVFWSLLYAVNSALQAAGDTRVPMLIGICVNAVNAVAAFLLINGPGPFPRLEVAGAGAGFSIAALVGALLGLGVLLSGRRTLRWRPFDGPPLDPREARRILWVGVPTGLEQAQFNIAFMLYTRIVASMGTTAVAAHGVTLAIQGLAFNAGFGISVATSALVGQGLGARRPDLSERATYLAARYALAVTTLVAVVLAVFGRQITSAFVAGEGADEVVDLGGKLMLIFALAMPGLGINLAFGGALRGAGDTRWVLAIVAFCNWVVRLVPAYLLAIVAGLGVPGAWVGAVLDLNSRALLLWLRFRRGHWKHIRV
jgi:putative MATE family efflux protein